MTGWIRPWRTRTARTGVAVALGLGAIPAAALASDPPDAFVLPGATLGAITADIDNDGAHEVVRLTGSAGSMELEVWDVDGGAWVATYSDEVGDLAGPGITVSGATPLTLLRTRVAGSDRVLAFSTGYDADSGLPTCCFTIHELVGDSGALALVRMDGPQPLAESVVAVDLDGDETDELVVWSVSWGEDGSPEGSTIEVLRREGGAWDSAASWEEEGPWWVAGVVESDGLPGFEVIASGDSDAFTRVAWIDGSLAIERERLLMGGEPISVAGSVDETLLVSTSRSVGLMRWPRGGEPTAVATYETRGYPLVGLVGRGSDALLVVQEHLDSGAMVPDTRILDMRLEVAGEVPSTPEALALWDLTDRMARSGSWGMSRNIWPYFGPADGDWREAATTFSSGGMLITAGAGGSFEFAPGASLVGQPVGPAGPDGAWVAVTDSYLTSGRVAYLQGGYAFSDARLVLVAREALLSPTERDLVREVAVADGIETGRENGAVTVLAASTGAEIVLDVAPGTIALSWDGSRVADHREVTDGTLRLEVDPPSRPRPGREYSFEHDLILVGPDGSVEVHRWRGTFAPEAPELTAWSNAEPLSLEATVAGRASPGSTVSVDGREVSLNRFGAYRATVGAPPWPRTVVVVARDPFGGEQRATVEIIGLVDYRGLPWVPLAGVATVLGGAVLFLRTPRHRPLAERPTLDDGRLEDLDGDVI